MERLTAAIEAKDKRFEGKLICVGSSFECTRVGKPDEFDFHIELTEFSDFCTPVPLDEVAFYCLQFNADRIRNSENYYRFFQRRRIFADRFVEF